MVHYFHTHDGVMMDEKMDERRYWGSWRYPQ
jgi:hypothetical protein